MDTETKLRFKLRLEVERDELLERAKAALGELTDKVVETSGDEADEAAALSETHLNLRFRDRERQLLEKIQGALERIKDGSFGDCEECGEAIPEKRLEIRPVATLCVKCKEIEEKREKEYA